MRVVFDTNILVAAFTTTNGRAEAAFALAARRRCRLLTSLAILTEAARVFRSKFGLPDEEVGSILKAVVRVAELVRPTSHLRLVHDEPDNRILECAIDGSADLIVTGDRALLRLRKAGAIPVVRLVDFLRSFPFSPDVQS